MRIASGFLCSFPSFLCLFLISACSDQQSNIALGTLERERIIFKATASEVIVALPVKEGSLVKTGELLVQLDDRRQQAKVAHAKAEVMRASAALEQLRNGARKEEVDAARAKVQGAQSSFDLAEKNLKRAMQLIEQQSISAIDLDRIKSERDRAESELETATKNLLTLTNGTRHEELEQGEAMLAAAMAQAELEDYILSELSIRATRDGYLDNLPWNEGERVQTGSTVAVLLASSSPYARVYVPESWRARLSVGQTLEVSVDGKDAKYEGVLRWIATDPAFTPYYALNKLDRSRLVYLAEIDIENATDLPTGIPAEVTLVDAFASSH